MTPVVIELAGEPKGKGRPRFARRNGIAYTPGKTRTYEAALRYAAQEVMAGRTPIEGAIELSVEAWMPIPKSWSKRRIAQASLGDIRPTTRPDFDNLLKVLDSFNGVVWRDDAQVTDVLFRKLYSQRPRLTITVKPVGIQIQQQDEEAVAA